MASNKFSIKMLQMFRAFSTSSRVVLPTVCVACGSAFVYYSAQNSSPVSNFWARFAKPNEVFAASVQHHHDDKTSAAVNESDACHSTREKRFHNFASVEVKGEHFMTPQDFLESVTEECPRQPKAGFSIAFNMFDTDGNQKVDKKEFMVLGEIFRKRTESGHAHQQAIQMDSDNLQDTTLLIHLFGRKGNNDIRYEDFYKFMDNLQTEVLEIEFLAYSHGMLTISEEDFARMLLKYTDVMDTDEYIDTLRKRIPEEKGITFEEFRSFFQFLNNLEDFAIAMQMYTLAGRSIGQAEFKRAVKISTGHELSEHLVDTLFQLFDKDGDNRLSHVEFMGVMKERIQRGFKPRSLNYGVGWSGFQKCMRYSIKNASTH